MKFSQQPKIGRVFFFALAHNVNITVIVAFSRLLQLHGVCAQQGHLFFHRKVKD